ncbi:M48 family metallopeptidase [Pseudooceanicola sp. HF7]|uniref:M48 family metallopeptidase n=1 Tax=Pseudooceanicola sp. HF7 TaxID=2721560 RepID=UPI001430AD8E|nr:SprT family zinc-dependent metalloprotease [Pseudooceanicola sp. HF7]NIZ10076.1 M48 family metallopeptidase [Pseudooceanicola sp. HF7]
MGQHVLPGNPPVPVTIRRSARARRISLRVSALDGRVTLTLPRHVPERQGLDFAHEKAEWLRSHLSARGDDVIIRPGALIPVEGQPREVRAGSGRSVRLGPETLEIPGSGDTMGPRLAAWLKALARDRLAEASDLYADRLGRGYARLTLRDTRSRWGSCTADAGLMYSWRLVMAPPEVLAYVAAHEVAHLAQMNHSPAFWAEVERIHGPYKTQRGWLRQKGSDLHRYRFDA